jgi:hypothetical protein
MAIINISFASKINISLQVGDTAYYVGTSAVDGFNVNSSEVVRIGNVNKIDRILNTIECTIGTYTPPPLASDYIFFSKDNKANMSNLLGYYADVKIANNSQDKAEMYNISVDYFESSK